MPQLRPSTVMKGAAVYFAAAVGGYLYLRSAKAPAPARCGCGRSHAGETSGSGTEGSSGESNLPPGEPTSGQETFDRIADLYDSCINTDETFMGIKLMRRWLVRQAEGDVLEVSAGTGRNLPYYNLSRLRSLTLTDTSRHMLINAAGKYAALAASKPGQAPVKFELADAEHLVARPAGGGSGSADLAAARSTGDAVAQPTEQQQQQQGTPVALAAGEQQGRPPLRQQQVFPPHSFDVVVDTFGLCSQQDPVTALKEMARVCKPGGRILLLQHGKGTWSFINNILDSGADNHFCKWGCWWNRDIERIVRQAGLEIQSLSRWHFGTTYLVVAQPAAGA